MQELFSFLQVIEIEGIADQERLLVAAERKVRRHAVPADAGVTLPIRIDAPPIRRRKMTGTATPRHPQFPFDDTPMPLFALERAADLAVGVLNGMGPEPTADFLLERVAAASRQVPLVDRVDEARHACRPA